MFATIAQPKPIGGNAGEKLYLLVMDARGNPLALSSLDKLPHSLFPSRPLELVAETRTLPGSGENAVAPLSPAKTLLHVESALKRLYDLAYLCEHPLAASCLVTGRLGAKPLAPTCLQRACVLRELLQETIAQLRPVGAAPARSSVPRREWQPYLILHHAYIEGENNYAIMRWLQISEGTFNRTRRRALQTVAKVLMEMEQAA